MGPRIWDHRFSDAARSRTVITRGEVAIPARRSTVVTTARSYWKLFLLLETLAEEAVRFGLLRLRRGRSLTLADRARWLGIGSGNILRRLHFPYQVTGTPPPRGLVVSNHLSHLDILFYASAYRCIFVSKYEVVHWPIFGWFARWGGTIFVKRERAADAVQAGRAVEEALASGVPVMLFPEGTSTDGTALLPFHPLLFEPAVRGGAPVTASAIGYRADDAAEQALCYYGDVPFGPHLLSCLSRRGVESRMAAAEPSAYTSRKQAAMDTQVQVARLRTWLSEQTGSVA